MQRGKPFQPGNQMGRGRPRGSRNQANKFADTMERHEDSLLIKLMTMALSGDRMAMRLCMEWLLSHKWPTRARIKMPQLKTPADLPRLRQWLLNQLTAGRVDRDLAEAIDKLLGSSERALTKQADCPGIADTGEAFDLSQLDEAELGLFHELLKRAAKKKDL
jgi:hypothetical protein